MKISLDKLSPMPHASLTKLSTQIIVLGSWNLESPYRDRDNTPILACGTRTTPCLPDLRTKPLIRKGSRSLVHKAETYAAPGPHANASGAFIHWALFSSHPVNAKTQNFAKESC